MPLACYVLLDASHVPLTLNFQAEESGQYRCRIVLRSSSGRGAGDQLMAVDARVFQVCCIVSPRGSKATIDFVSPVNTAVVQNIPVVSGILSGDTSGRTVEFFISKR